MSSGNQCQAVIVIESLRDILSECVPRTSRGYPPPASVIWVGPEKVAHWPFMGDLLYAVKRSDVVQGVNAGRQATVEAEYLIIDKGCEW